MRILYLVLALSCMLIVTACEKKASPDQAAGENVSGLKIAYVNGDSILMNFQEFRVESEAMEERKRKAEEDLQQKGKALEQEFLAYQQQAQKGTLTGKEMEAKERYLTSRQEAILADRDKMAKEILEETDRINDRLQKAIHDILDDIKKEEGYDFIFSYIAGGPILVADEKHDITERVLEELNKNPSSSVNDTTGNR